MRFLPRISAATMTGTLSLARSGFPREIPPTKFSSTSNVPDRSWPSGHDYRAAELVHPDPGRLVRLQAQDPLQFESGNPVLLRGHEPDRSEPGAYGDASAVEDRASRHRRASGAVDAHPQPLARTPRVHATTFRAHNPSVQRSRER